jgi:hypothetical protein
MNIFPAVAASLDEGGDGRPMIPSNLSVGPAPLRIIKEP